MNTIYVNADKILDDLRNIGENEISKLSNEEYSKLMYDIGYKHFDLLINPLMAIKNQNKYKFFNDFIYTVNHDSGRYYICVYLKDNINKAPVLSYNIYDDPLSGNLLNIIDRLKNSYDAINGYEFK